MKKRILLIDDEVEIRDLLRQALSQAGYEVVEASSGAEAKHIAAEKSLDVIISDLQLEDTDGLSLIAEIKQTLPNIPILLLTGVIFDPETIRETVSRHVTVYLEKTTKLQRILDEVSRICQTGKQ